MVVGALIVKHVEKLSDEKSIQAIQENPYMQYLLGLEEFTEKPAFVPELFVLVRKRLDHDFFNMLPLMLAEADGSKPKRERTDEDGNDHGGTMKIDATCCDAEVRYPTDSNLLEDGSGLIDRLLDKFCARHKVKKPQTHRTEARQAFIGLIKKKRKGKKLIDKTKLIQIRCLQADFQLFLDFLGKQSSTLLACFSRHDYMCLQAAFKMYEQQKMMFEQMSADVPTASSVSINLTSVPSSGARQRPRSSLGQRLVPASSTATLMWIISAGTHTTSRPTSSPRWNSTKSVSACCPGRYRPTSSTWGKRIGSTSSLAISIATIVHWADLPGKRTTHTQRTRREPSASEMK